jgi:hypothetical protein
VKIINNVKFTVTYTVTADSPSNPGFLQKGDSRDLKLGYTIKANCQTLGTAEVSGVPGDATVVFDEEGGQFRIRVEG